MSRRMFVRCMALPRVAILRLAVGVGGAEQLGEHDSDRAADVLAVAFEVVFGFDRGTCEVVAHPLAEFDQRFRRQRVSSREVREDARLGGIRLLAVCPALDGFDSLLRLRVVLVYEVIDRAQHAVELAGVGLEVAGQQADARAEGARVQGGHQVALSLYRLRAVACRASGMIASRGSDVRSSRAFTVLRRGLAARALIRSRRPLVAGIGRSV